MEHVSLISNSKSSSFKLFAHSISQHLMFLSGKHTYWPWLTFLNFGGCSRTVVPSFVFAYKSFIKLKYLFKYNEIPAYYWLFLDFQWDSFLKFVSHFLRDEKCRIYLKLWISASNIVSGTFFSVGNLTYLHSGPQTVNLFVCAVRHITTEFTWRILYLCRWHFWANSCIILNSIEWQTPINSLIFISTTLLSTFSFDKLFFFLLTSTV